VLPRYRRAKEDEASGKGVRKSELSIVPTSTGNAAHADPEEGSGSQE